jgi:transcriptional regulator with XRE-family HTH domain
MRNRLKEFMLSKSVSAAEFADRIGVQRSNISHILNGRNNPGAQFLEKLLTAFPDLNADWLITGRGEMLKNEKISPETGIPKRNESWEADSREGKGMVKQEGNPAATEAGNRTGAFRDAEKIIFFYPDHTFITYYPNQ